MGLIKKSSHVFFRSVSPVILYYLLMQVTGMMAMVFFWKINPEKLSLPVTMISAMVAIWILWPSYKKSMDIRNIHCKNGRTLPDMKIVAVLCLIGVSACMAGNILIAGSGLSSQAYEDAARRLYAPGLSLQIAGIGILAPFAEELIFRGLGYARLREELSFFPAAALSSLLFACFHGNIVQGVYAFGIGILLAWSLEICKRLWAPAVLHMSANLFSIFMGNTSWKNTLGQNTGLDIVALAVTGIVVIWGIGRLNRLTKQNKIVEIREDGMEQ